MHQRPEHPKLGFLHRRAVSMEEETEENFLAFYKLALKVAVEEGHKCGFPRSWMSFDPQEARGGRPSFECRVGEDPRACLRVCLRGFFEAGGHGGEREGVKTC